MRRNYGSLAVTGTTIGIELEVGSYVVDLTADRAELLIESLQRGLAVHKQISQTAARKEEAEAISRIVDSVRKELEQWLASRGAK